MARICIRVAPNDHPTDSSLTPLRTRVGDVVVIVNDDHVFSECERNNGQYKIVNVTDATQEELLHMVASVYDVNGKMTKRRNVTINTTLIISGGSWPTSVTKAQLATVTIART